MDFFQKGYTKICNTGKTKSHKEIYVVSNSNTIYIAPLLFSIVKKCFANFHMVLFKIKIPELHASVSI